MRHRKHTFKVGRDSAHRKALLANLVCSLFESGRIETTLTKAKEARRLAEKMITLGKRGTLHDRRNAIATLGQTDIVGKLFSEIAPQYQDRNGGYTRVLKLGRRIGDAAEMSLLELVTEPVAAVEEVAAPVAAEEAPVEEAPAENSEETEESAS